MEIDNQIFLETQEQTIEFSNEKIDNSCIDQQDEICRLAFVGANEV